MQKAQAIQMLGGTVSLAAQAVGVTTSAVTQWPEELPPRLVDRVQAALWRKQHGASEEVSEPSESPAAFSERHAPTAIGMGLDQRHQRDDSPEADANYEEWRRAAKK